jgi:hypothetical protein
MKDVLIEKFERRYGPNRERMDDNETKSVSESILRDEVNDFVTKAALTEGNLARLERRMRHHARQKIGSSDTESVISAYSIATRQTGQSGLSGDPDQSPRPLQTLEGIPEDDETPYDWGMLDEHAKFLHELEIFRAQQGIKEQRQKLKSELDKQLADQLDRRKVQKDYDRKYHEELLEELSKWNDIDAKKDEEKLEKQTQERVIRDNQLQRDKQIRSEEADKRKRDEELFVRKIAVEVIAEKDNLLKKKERDREVFKNMFLENETDKQQKKEELERQRERDLEYALEYGRIQDRQDNQKKAELQVRINRQKQREKNMEKLAADITQQETDDAAKCARQRLEIETRLIEMEQNKEEKLKKQRQDTQTFLLRQMQDKVDKKEERKQNRDMQATILAEDSAEFIRQKNKEIAARKERNVLHRLELQKQIQKRKQFKQDAMSAEEVALNRDLLNTVDRLLLERKQICQS